MAEPSRWALPPAPAAAATPSWRINADPSPASSAETDVRRVARPLGRKVELGAARHALGLDRVRAPERFGSADHACSVALAGESASARAASQRLAPPGATRPTSVATSSSFCASRVTCAERPFGPERRSPRPRRRQVRTATTSPAKFVAGLGQFERQRAAFEPGVAGPTNPQFRRLQRQRQIGVADQRGAGVEIRQRVDVERVAVQIHEQARAFPCDRRGVGDRAGERRAIQRQIEVTGRKRDRRDLAPLRSPKRCDRAALGSARRGGAPIPARRESPRHAAARCRRAGPSTRP